MSAAEQHDLSTVRDGVDDIIAEAQQVFEELDQGRIQRAERLDELLHVYGDLRDDVVALHRDLGNSERVGATLQARVSEGERREVEYKERVLDGERRIVELQHHLADARRNIAGLEKERSDVQSELDELRIQHVRLAGHFRDFLHSLGERARMIQNEDERLDALRQLAHSLAVYGQAGRDESRRFVEGDGAHALPPQEARPTVRLIPTNAAVPAQRDGERA